MNFVNTFKGNSNGMFLGRSYLPEEILISTFVTLKPEDLLNCQMVCKDWQDIIKSVVWRKKAENAMGRKLPVNKKIPWYVYYIISRNVCGRNLIKNHSGEYGMKYWIAERVDWQFWKIESPPRNVPKLPNDPVFEGKNYCFVSYYNYKCQLINLPAAGFFPKFMDTVQPTIKVSVWYNITDNWNSQYYLYRIALYKENWTKVDEYKYKILPEAFSNDKSWNTISHVIENYGPGIRMIRFCHSGYTNCKIAGVCVKIMPPERLVCIDRSDNKQ